MRYCPKFVYVDEEGESQVVALNEPQRPWRKVTNDVGGWARTTTGIAESYVLREDYMLTLDLRVREIEEQNFVRFLQWARRNAGATFDFYYDKNDPSNLKKVCDLDSPKVGEQITFNQSDYPGINAIQITLRSADGSYFTRNYYADA